MGAREPPGSRIPKLEGSDSPSIYSLMSIWVEGIEKLVSNLNVTKACSAEPSPLPIWGWSDVRKCGLVALDPQDRDTWRAHVQCSLVLPHAIGWDTDSDPYRVGDSNQLDWVQRPAARFLFSDYSYSSITDMLHNLVWKTSPPEGRS